MIAIPTLILGVVCLLKRHKGRRWIPFGLLLSAVGDAAGGMGLFGLQMGAFALALSCYVVDFVSHSQFQRRRLGWFVIAMIAFFGALYPLIGEISTPIEVIAVGVYASLLFVLLATALFQVGQGWGWYIVATLLFILSDAMIGYTRYIEPLPTPEWATLLPYYSAQAIFAWRHLSPEEQLAGE